MWLKLAVMFTPPQLGMVTIIWHRKKMVIKWGWFMIVISTLYIYIYTYVYIYIHIYIYDITDLVDIKHKITIRMI